MNGGGAWAGAGGERGTPGARGADGRERPTMALRELPLACERATPTWGEGQGGPPSCWARDSGTEGRERLPRGGRLGDKRACPKSLFSVETGKTREFPAGEQSRVLAPSPQGPAALHGSVCPLPFHAWAS